MGSGPPSGGKVLAGGAAAARAAGMAVIAVPPGVDTPNSALGDRGSPRRLLAGARAGGKTPSGGMGGVVNGATLSGADGEGSPGLELIRRMRRLEEDAISQCRDELKAMQRATLRQKNISIDVKAAIAKMAELFDVVSNYRRTWKAAEGERTLTGSRGGQTVRQLADASTSRA